MPLVMQKWITRQDLRDNPESIYIFGDNALRFGLGGQAKECRDEPNAIGIITKRAPNNDPESFLTSADLPQLQQHYLDTFRYLMLCLVAGKTIVWPADGIGTGLADLPNKAPDIHTALTIALMQLQELSDDLEKEKSNAA